MPLNETMPVSILPDETTVSPLAIENSTYSSIDSDKEFLNATTVSSMPSSTQMNLEGMDHRQSKRAQILKFDLLHKKCFYSLWPKNVPRGENCWRCKGSIRSMALANFVTSMANFNLSPQMRKRSP